MSQEHISLNTQRIWTFPRRISALYTVLAGYIGAAAFTQSTGLFVTFMTGNAEKNVLGVFRHDPEMSIAAFLLTVSFFLGVLSAMASRKYLWKQRPYCVILLTAISLSIASIFAFSNDYTTIGGVEDYQFLDLIFVAYATGALNCAFTRGGETATPVTYHSGNLTKCAQGLGKHIFHQGSYRDWMGYAISYLSFSLGALIGGVMSLVITGSVMFVSAAIISFIIFVCIYPKIIPLSEQ